MFRSAGSSCFSRFRFFGAVLGTALLFCPAVLPGVQAYTSLGTGTAALDRDIRALGAVADPLRQSAAINAIEKSWFTHFGQMPLTNGPDIWAYRSGVANLGPAVFASLHPVWEDVGWMAQTSGP